MRSMLGDAGTLTEPRRHFNGPGLQGLLRCDDHHGSVAKNGLPFGCIRDTLPRMGGTPRVHCRTHSKVHAAPTTVATRMPNAVPESRPAEHAPINWVTTILFTVTPLVALTVVPWYGFTHGFSAAAWILAAVFLWASGVSITAGYHRLWSHRTYSAHWSVRLFLMLFGAMALQNSILIWGSQHRTHHRFVDDVDKDPYSAKRGFWFSHMGWILRNYPSGVNDFTNARDLERDPLVMFQHRWYLPLTLFMNIGLPLLAGWAVGDVWGVFLLAGVLRLVVNHHFTWFINSLAHMWGSQPYTDENTARDNGALALLTYGEGYHNFHHIFQNDYRNGVRWWQYDPTKWLIAGLSFVGLTSGLKRVPDLWI